MTVKEMREWLKRFPDDTEVEVIAGNMYEGCREESLSADTDEAEYYRDDGTLKDFIWGENWEYLDFTERPISVGIEIPGYVNKRVLILGEIR